MRLICACVSARFVCWRLCTTQLAYSDPPSRPFRSRRGWRAEREAWEGERGALRREKGSRKGVVGAGGGAGKAWGGSSVVGREGMKRRGHCGRDN